MKLITFANGMFLVPQVTNQNVNQFMTAWQIRCNSKNCVDGRGANHAHLCAPDVCVGAPGHALRGLSAVGVVLRCALLHHGPHSLGAFRSEALRHDLQLSHHRQPPGFVFIFGVDSWLPV